MSLEDASKRLEVAFKDTENRLDAVGKKVDSALVGLTEHQNGKYLYEHKHIGGKAYENFFIII